jgi:hypothetical protein
MRKALRTKEYISQHAGTNKGHVADLALLEGARYPMQSTGGGVNALAPDSRLVALGLGLSALGVSFALSDVAKVGSRRRLDRDCANPQKKPDPASSLSICSSQPC